MAFLNVIITNYHILYFSEIVSLTMRRGNAVTVHARIQKFS